MVTCSQYFKELIGKKNDKIILMDLTLYIFLLEE